MAAKAEYMAEAIETVSVDASAAGVLITASELWQQKIFFMGRYENCRNVRVCYKRAEHL